MIMTQTLPEVRIKVNGRPIKKYTDQSGKLWVESRDNSNYSIEVKNNNSSRILAVISVDGINIITGKEAKIEPEDGYIINAYSNLDAKGWRISNDEEKSFYFSVNKSDSYAVKLGSGSKNLGVIGVVFYSEKQIPISTTTYVYYPKYIPYREPFINPYREPYRWDDYRYTGAVTNGYSTDVQCNVTLDGIANSGYIPDTELGVINTTSIRDMSMGTGKGESISSHVNEVGFDVDQYLGMTSIFYDSIEELKAKGIMRESGLPSPFKSEKFCPDV